MIASRLTGFTLGVLVGGACAAAETLQSIGEPEGFVDIVAWPGCIERGETDEMVALMNEGGFDLVTASGDASLRLIAGKRVQPINTDLIPSWSTVDERLQAAPWHTVDGVHYGVPNQWGSNVLMYNTEVFPEPPQSWSVVFQEATLPDGQSNRGRIQAFDGPIYIADAAHPNCAYLMDGAFPEPQAAGRSGRLARLGAGGAGRLRGQ